MRDGNKPAKEFWMKASEILAGQQPEAVEAIEEVADKSIDDMTVRELVEFIEISVEELNPFWR